VDKGCEVEVIGNPESLVIEIYGIQLDILCSHAQYCSATPARILYKNRGKNWGQAPISRGEEKVDLAPIFIL
jgi:hypothetical protein